MVKRVFIVGAKRTPIGKFGGALASKTAAMLGGLAIEGALNQAQLPTEANVDQVFMGNVLQAGSGQNPARQASQLAGLGDGVPAVTMNDVCGSGLTSINLAAAMIQSGQADIMVAGGMESMSNAPYVLDKARFGYRLGDGMMRDTILSDALTDAEGDFHMGITAENVAQKYDISREAMDAFSLASHQKAAAAIERGDFDTEIVPVPVTVKRETTMITQDEGPRPDSSLEKLARLKPAFQEDGRVTAGNASGINDGAAAIVLVSEDALEQYGLTALAEWQGASLVGLDPTLMGVGPYYAVDKLLGNADLTVDDINVFELNEAFAAQALASNQLLTVDEARVNPRGGAIALGHPVGASGARVLVSLIHELQPEERGVAALCIGGGMGVSALITRR
ncbi:thiolase family protein [Weissella tructae]|uniref:acetyl-CoA C-acetyltransferase n=2 Tax=Weissella TaxID=46255 RepID=A0A075U052_9LACO|nr:MULTISPECIES: acetyl-CoA C-acetyltransferase [Weissella]AIG65583.1 Acetyl-CoA acetyltransferase [Weissella tructae]AIM62898.1 Acetyl-CoA acetyltransferase [Weissella ceti]AIM64296.1 Acetyl-CoA acetyltransferase [Weissella ceti]ELA06960.1 acetyl-CoA acetyltransferase [Weissella ceti NC36]QVV90713.1 acetyl-CoA C-acetyltransferase [Weissella tructae]